MSPGAFLLPHLREISVRHNEPSSFAAAEDGEARRMRLHRLAADRRVDRQPVTGHQKVTVAGCDEVLDGWRARDLRQAALEILGGPVSRTVGARDLELRRKHAADSLLLAARDRAQP